MHHVRLNDI